MFVKASSTNVFKRNAIVFRGKCKAVKDSRPYGKQQNRKEPSAMETACVIQNKNRAKGDRKRESRCRSLLFHALFSGVSHKLKQDTGLGMKRSHSFRSAWSKLLRRGMVRA